MIVMLPPSGNLIPWNPGRPSRADRTIKKAVKVLLRNSPNPFLDLLFSYMIQLLRSVRFLLWMSAENCRTGSFSSSVRQFFMYMNAPCRDQPAWRFYLGFLLLFIPEFLHIRHIDRTEQHQDACRHDHCGDRTSEQREKHF